MSNGMSTHGPAHRPIPSDGLTLRWNTWDDAHREVFTLTWENEAWTASGLVSRERVQYVFRLSPTWQVRQFLLFRDLDEPDLWLANDGAGRWGEMNGAHRTDLDGCIDIALACTPFTATLPIRRLPLEVGDAAVVLVAVIDTETLGIDVQTHRYVRHDTRHWQRTVGGITEGFDVDEFGFVVDQTGLYRRTAVSG